MSARILVVDDNPLNLKLLSAKLTHDYYVVTTATSGFETLTRVENEKPDIILLDVMMPDMDGFETCRRLKAGHATSHIPVVMVTALSDTSDRLKGLEAGADDFLTKPINDVALMARVRSLLRLKRIMDEWQLREGTLGELSAEPIKGSTISDAVAGCRAILMEDDPVEREFIADALKSLAVEVFETESVTEAAAAAQSGKYDLVYASLDLKKEDGLLICSTLRAYETTRQLPILLLASDTEMTRMARGMDLGANDYLMRPVDANELLARTRTQLRQKRHYDRMRKNYENSFVQALTDPLTGAFNRRYLDAHLPRLLGRTSDGRKPLAAMMIDIDHFRQFNDTHGHAAGDTVLREVVDRMVKSLRPSDIVVRMGGEEFAVILPETDLSAASIVSERMRESVASSPVLAERDGTPVSVTISIGVALFRSDASETAEALLKRADQGLYEAKRSGRNRVITEQAA